MDIAKSTEAYRERVFSGGEPDLLRTDPEFIEIFENFAFDEAARQRAAGK